MPHLGLPPNRTLYKKKRAFFPTSLEVIGPYATWAPRRDGLLCEGVWQATEENCILAPDWKMMLREAEEAIDL